MVADLSSPENFMVLADPDERTVSMFTGLGMSLPKGTVELKRDLGFAATASRERIDLLDASVTIFASAKAENLASYQNDPLFQQLAASKREAVVNMDLAPFSAIRQPSPISIP